VAALTAAGIVDVTDWIRETATTSVRLLVLDETGGGRRCHKQRAADAVVLAAAAAGHRGVTAGSCGNYGVAIAVAAARHGLAVTIVVPTTYGQADIQRILALGAHVVRVGNTYEDAVTASRQLASGDQLADGNVNGPFATAASAALGEIVARLDRLPDRPPAGLWVPLGNGTTLAAVGETMLRRGWPTRVFGASSPGNNSILASWPSRQHRPLPPTAVVPTAANEPLVNWDALHGQQALDILHTSSGAAVGVPDAQLESAHRPLRRAGLTASSAGSAGVAALVLAASGTGLTEGSHVAVLTG
jgi:threonine synthase